MEAKLTLVGAGPGDPDLISLKGVKALASADVVLYDALVHPALLDYCKADAEKYFVGKRSGKHSYKQEEINQMIVDYALSKGHVVRLKGGDPFIFARGKEELEYAETFNIKTASIPGISSINLPGCYGIPLTRRGVNESFWVITATNSRGVLSSDVNLAARSSATVVLLMGLKKLGEIAEIFMDEGKQDLPVAVISNGSLPHAKLVLSSIKSIISRVAREKVEAPALIVIGEAVGTHHQFYVTAENLRAELL